MSIPQKSERQFLRRQLQRRKNARRISRTRCGELSRQIHIPGFLQAGRYKRWLPAQFSLSRSGTEWASCYIHGLHFEPNVVAGSAGLWAATSFWPWCHWTCKLFNRYIVSLVQPDIPFSNINKRDKRRRATAGSAWLSLVHCRDLSHSLHGNRGIIALQDTRRDAWYKRNVTRKRIRCISRRLASKE